MLVKRRRHLGTDDNHHSKTSDANIPGCMRYMIANLKTTNQLPSSAVTHPSSYRNPSAELQNTLAQTAADWSEPIPSTRRSAAAAADNTRRFSAMDRPLSSSNLREREAEDTHMPDSPGDALGALKKVVGARQQRIGTLA
jgi:hypothetical protein